MRRNENEHQRALILRTESNEGILDFTTPEDPKGLIMDTSRLSYDTQSIAHCQNEIQFPLTQGSPQKDHQQEPLELSRFVL